MEVFFSCKLYVMVWADRITGEIKERFAHADAGFGTIRQLEEDIVGMARPGF